MPRVYDLDDDDYFPREQGGKSGRRFPVLLFGGIAVVVIVVIWGALFTMRSSRQAAERDAEAFARTAVVKTASDSVSHDGNWSKAIGKWTRQPKNPDDVGAPLVFEFHQNMTGQITWLRRDGSQDTQSFQVDVTANQGDLLAVRFHNGKPAYTFRLTVNPNGTLLLRDSMTIYSRQ